MSKIDTANVVAWQSVHYGIPIDETHDPAEAQKWLDSGVTVRPLYTSPQPSKPWVHATTWRGLTDEEKRQLFECENYDGWLDYINAIEAKLKEKNGF